MIREDSSRLTEFLKEMVRKAQVEPGVIDTFTYKGREEHLNNTYEEIDVSEKVLNEYLEQKKSKM